MQSQKTARSVLWINLLGFLSALAVALGGWVLVQGVLSMEEKTLLSGGGQVELYREGSIAAAESKDISVSEPLTEEELVQVIAALESREEILLHEPGQEQLSMTGAIRCGMSWLEEIFVPYLGVSDFLLRNTK